MLVDTDGTRISVRDIDSNITFLEIELTPDQLSAILSRRADVKVDINVHALDKIGKTHHNKRFEFKLPEGFVTYENKNKIYELACKQAPEGWEVDDYFGSQDSFFFDDDGNKMCGVIIRQWI